MNGFVHDLNAITLANRDFRKVLYTARHCQLVAMSLEPGVEIGEEVHQADQFFRIESGTASVVIDGVPSDAKAGFAILVPAGTRHNIANAGGTPLKLYTLYAPPHHRDGVVHHSRAHAQGDHEHFDGRTTEP